MAVSPGRPGPHRALPLNNVLAHSKRKWSCRDSLQFWPALMGESAFMWAAPGSSSPAWRGDAESRTLWAATEPETPLCSISPMTLAACGLEHPSGPLMRGLGGSRAAAALGSHPSSGQRTHRPSGEGTRPEGRCPRPVLLQTWAAGSPPQAAGRSGASQGHSLPSSFRS